MKKILLFSLFISIRLFGQSVTIVPSNGQFTEFLKIKKNGFGLDHRTVDNLVGVGTFAANNSAYVQTHTPHSLFFSTNNGDPFMTIAYSATAGLNGNIGINNISPQEKLHVVGNIRTSSLAGTGLRPVIADANGILKPTTIVAFAVHNLIGTGDISVAHQTYLTLPFTTKDYDLGGNFSTSTYQFTAPVRGIYHFDVQVSWVTSTNSVGNYDLQLEKNGTYITVQGTPLISGQFSSNTVSTDIDLEVGDAVKAVVYQDSGATQKLQGFNRLSRFSGRLVMPL
ncbi:complement C1q domain-containing protein [Lacihabitans sp. CCS-44]|uniref:complement C1q domain-containing protein n=1 Tax=Lacihabitans sp. CCS-44 TaxID=2487331 RepID=UPI0020CC94C5|nr:complement C1q domain-containing protein [Lacihabitans sp. CCS-44]